MDPDLIVSEGQRLRHVLLSEAVAVEYGYSPGNSTLYELTFMPAELAGYTSSPGDPAHAPHRKPGDLLVAKSNGTPSLTWATWLPLLTPAPMYLDPGYLKGIINCTDGDVGPLGLFLNAVAGVGRAQLDASPYIDVDRKLVRAPHLG